MKFTDLYPSFGDFKTKLNARLANTVADTDAVFYTQIASIFVTRDFLSDQEEIVASQVFSKWKNVKLKWVKLLSANETELLNLLTQESQNENYTGSLTETDLEAKKFLSTGASSKFKPAIIDRIGVVVGLPDFFDEISREFEPLFFNISPTFLKNLDPDAPKTKIGTDLVFLANPGTESLNPADRLQSEANAHFKAAIKALQDGGGGTVLPEKLEWLNSQLETLPNTTEEVFLNAVFIYYIKSGQKLFLATTILMLLDEVETNSNNIAGNSSDIVDLEVNVAGLVSQINALGNRLNEAESDISDNKILITDIKTKTDKIFFLDEMSQKDIFDKFFEDEQIDNYFFSFGGRVFHFSYKLQDAIVFVSSDFQNFSDTWSLAINYFVLPAYATELSIPIAQKRYTSINSNYIYNLPSNVYYRDLPTLDVFNNFVARKLFPSKTPILDFWNNTPLTVIDDNEVSNSRYTFSNFSTPRWDFGGEYGFTFSAVLSKNSQIGDESVVGLQSLFNFKNATLNAWKFVPVVHLTSPTGRVYVVHSAYKTGSLNYHYIHVYLGGLPTSGNKLDAELGTWIVHFKLYHAQTLPETRQIQTKKVKSKEDLFFEKLKADYEKAKKMEAKNAKSRLN